MKCPSGKRLYFTQQDAEEALIGSRINFHHEELNGPINIYECRDCGNYHLTSRPPIHPILLDEEVKKQIKLERESREWERRFK